MRLTSINLNFFASVSTRPVEFKLYMEYQTRLYKITHAAVRSKAGILLLLLLLLF